MSYKKKLIILSLVINSLVALSDTDKVTSQVIVEGKNATVKVRKNRTIELQGKDYDDSNGDVSLQAAAWIENGGTLINQGKIFNGDNTYRSHYISVVVGGITNNLEKTDNLLVLNESASLKNSGTIEMGGIIHNTQQTGISLGGSVTGSYANYNKNVIAAKNSEIVNEKNGIIKSKGDTFSHTSTLDVSLITKTYATYNKNILNLDGGNIKNDGIIEYDSDYNPQNQSYVGVDLLNLGLTYERNVSGIKAINNVTIENSGTIRVKGDIYKGNSTGGLNLGLLGADFMGYHNKAGVNLTGGKLINTGNIEVERDFIKALVNGSIVDATFTDGPLIHLGLLSFKNMTEKSVGVSLNNSTFENNGGTIKVGSNNKETQITTTSGAIAIEADNNSNITFTDGKIELTGLSVYATNLTNNSTITFKGNSKIDIVTESDSQYKVNEEIFKNDQTSKHVLEGTLTVDGNVVVQKGNNLVISKGTTTFGTLIADNITLNEDIKVDVSKLIENKIDKLEDQTVLIAKNNIEGNGSLISNNYLFNVETNKNNSLVRENGETLSINISKKKFSEIVENEELGNILDEAYDSLTPVTPPTNNEEEGIPETKPEVKPEEKPEIIPEVKPEITPEENTKKDLILLLAQANDKKSFNETIDQLTGEKNINSLGTQVYNIVDELNSEYNSFIKEMKDEELTVRYVNSNSELLTTTSSDGFKRESKGIMIGYGFSPTNKLKTGFGISYLDSKVDYDSNNSNNKITTWDVRGFTNLKTDFANYITELSFGYNKAKNSRDFVVGNKNNTFNGKVNLYTLGFNQIFYKNYKITEKLEFIPSVYLNTTFIYQDNYNESNGDFNVSLASNKSFFIQSGLDLMFKYDLTNNIALTSEFKYSYDFINKSENLKEKINILDGEFTIKSRELDRNSLDCKLGVCYNRDDYSIGINYSKELINEVDNDTVNVNFNYKF